MAQNSVQYTVNLNGNAIQGIARLDNATNKACAACQKANSQFAKTGDKVTIQLGYNGNLQTEFKGYLKTIKTDDKNIKIEIKTTLPDGTEIKAEYGTENGQTKTRKVSAATQQDLLTLAKNEYNLLCYDGYEGSLTGWLVPYCQPTDQIKIIDADYPQKEGCYYVIATEVNFNSNGATRKITIGRKTR